MIGKPIVLIFDSQKSGSPRTSLASQLRPSSPSQSSWSSSDRHLIADQARCSSSWWRRALWPWHLVGRSCQWLLSYSTHFYHIPGYICFSCLGILYTILPQSIWETTWPFLSAVSNACLLLNKVNGHQHSNIFQLVTKERNSLEWMTRRGCLGVRTKVTPGLCLSLRSHIRHIRSARTLPLSRTLLSTICTFLSYTLRSSCYPELLSVQQYARVFQCSTTYL